MKKMIKVSYVVSVEPLGNLRMGRGEGWLPQEPTVSEYRDGPSDFTRAPSASREERGAVD